MATDIIVPTLGESVTEATVAKWFKAVGDPVSADEPLVELETDKVTVEVNAPASGTLEAISADEGAEVEVGGVLGAIGEGDGAGAAKPKAKAEAPIKQAEPKAERTPPQPAAAPQPAKAPAPAASAPAAAVAPAQALAPAVRKLIEENGLDAAQIPASGKDGRLTKGDVLAFIETRAKAGPAAPAARAPEAPKAPPAPRPVGRQRGAGEDDPAPADDRAAAEGRAEHRGHAHDLQRGRHDRGQRAPRASTAKPSRRSTAPGSASCRSSSRPASSRFGSSRR